MTTNSIKVPISKRALITRINRHLPPGRILRIARGAARAALGDYYVVDHNGVERKNLDLEKFAREIGVLKKSEILEP